MRENDYRFRDFGKEISPEDRLEADRNSAMHNDAKTYAQSHDTFVLCAGLLYAPSGIPIAAIFNYDPRQASGLEELLRRVGGVIWPL